MTLRLTLPIKTVSLLNKREVWQVTARRKKDQREIVAWNLKPHKPPALPVTVTLTRVSAGTLDAHDNLPSAFKHVVDALALWLGIDDSDKRVAWLYAQEKAPKGHHSIIVEIN